MARQFFTKHTKTVFVAKNGVRSSNYQKTSWTKKFTAFWKTSLTEKSPSTVYQYWNEGAW